MSSLVQMFRSTLGRKFLMALTGLGLAGFTLTHMAGNLILFLGPDAYNTYGYQLTHNKAFLYTAEVGLLLLFVVHVGNAILLNARNAGARRQGYDRGTNGEKGVTLSSKTMPITGVLILVFVLVHLNHFKFGEHIDVTVAGTKMRDLYTLVAGSFGSPTSPWLWGYLIAMGILCLHLIHGVQSTAQSLGAAGKPSRDLFEKAGAGLALVVSVGFCLPPLYLAFLK